MDPSRYRIVFEVQQMMKRDTPGISARQDQRNIRQFHCSIKGPVNSPYEGGVFDLNLVLPKTYPMVPPRVKFLTKIHHPNVDHDGNISLSILREDWIPILQIRTVLLSIQSLLSNPNFNDSFPNRIGKLWKTNPEKAKMDAKAWTIRYATDPADN